MKTLAIILTIVLGLQVNALSAANPDRSSNKSEITGSCLAWLAPVAPLEATFEDAGTVFSNVIDLASLQPETPREADFSDAVPGLSLAPVVPLVADFTDSNEELPAEELTSLAPESPTEADFE